MSSETPKLSFMDHIRELRNRLIVSIIVIFIGSVVCFIFYQQIFDILEYPARQITFTSIDMMERASSIMLVSIVGGIILAMPVLIYELIMFVAPALTPREKRWVFLIIPWIFVMFLGGVAFGFLVLAPWTMKFLATFGSSVAEFFPRIGNYIGFLSKLVLLTGLLFEMPVISTFLARIRVLKPQWLVKGRPFAIVLAFVIGAILTPPDPVSQAILAVPLLILYEMSIFLAKRAYPRPAEPETAEVVEA
jgi:sec-independent protein translocase protein TatC